MKKSNILTVIFPSIILVLITMISFNPIELTKNLDLNGFFILSLVLIYPTMLFIQGILVSKNKASIILSFGLSIITFTIIMVVLLNTSASIYFALYIFSWLLGYFISKILFNKEGVKDKA